MPGSDVEGSVSQVETTETAPAETAPASEPEKAPFEPPSWIYEQEAEPKSEVKAETNPTPPTEPQWNPPVFDQDLLARDGNKYMDWYQRQWLGPVAQAQLQHQREVEKLKQRLNEPQIHPALINENMRRAQDGLSKALERFSGDPAFASANLRKRMEDYYKGFLKEARSLARRGDFSGINAMADEDFHDTTFEYFKRKAGFRGGRPPGSVASPEAALETPKGHAVAGEARFTKDEEDAYKYAHEKRGISRSDFAKMLKLDKEQREE